MNNEPTAEQIRTTCHYNPETGLFVRIKKRTWIGNWRDCYSVPTAKTVHGYLQMNMNGWPYLVHRLIFLYMEGNFPDADVDHVNGDRMDNRWTNLRLVTRQDNLRNQGVRTDNTSGQIGVHLDKRSGKWFAYIGVGGGKRESLGTYETFEEAVTVRKDAEFRYGYHRNHGAREGWKSDD